MGAICCIQMNSTKRMIVQQSKEDQEKALIKFKAYYKNNKPFMHQKIRAIFKQISLTGKYEPSIVKLNFVSFLNVRVEFFTTLIPFALNLTTLKLWKTCLGSEGMKAIANDLGTLSKLEILSLEDNSIGAEGCIYLSEALKNLKKLRELWLHINDIGVVGATSLSTVIGGLKELERLELDENNIEDSGATRLVSVIEHMKNIKMLGLGYNMMTQDTCLKIAAKFTNLPLEKLIFTGNPISEESQSQFFKLLPKVLIIF